MKCLLLFLLMSCPPLAFGALNVTTSFDLDRDGDTDGRDLSAFCKNIGLIHVETFSAHFGGIPGERAAPLTPTVMVINFDPILESRGGVRLTQYLGWNAVAPLVEQHILDIRSSSGGHVNYLVVDSRDVDAFPVKADGFQYTDETYLECQASGGTACHYPDGVDYQAILSEFGVCDKLNSGEIDEVWLFGGPWFGYYESRLAGPGGFWYNSPPLEDTLCDRLLPIMGFNYERGNAEMIHSFGHRAESSMTRVFGSWDVGREPLHDWDLYGHNLGQTFITDVFQCGSVHFPPNGTGDYDYCNNWDQVESACADWFNYPDFKGSTEMIDCTSWGCNQNGYLQWWLDHMPRQTGFHEGKLLNWWEYIVGQRYDAIYPRVVDFSSEYASGWADLVLDGSWGVCNINEWATAGQSTGWVKIRVNENITSILLYDRACPEQVTAGRIEFDDGTILSFGELENSGTLPTNLAVNKDDVQWIKVYIDESVNGPNPGIGEVVIE